MRLCNLFNLNVMEKSRWFLIVFDTAQQMKLFIWLEKAYKFNKLIQNERFKELKKIKKSKNNKNNKKKKKRNNNKK